MKIWFIYTMKYSSPFIIKLWNLHMKISHEIWNAWINCYSEWGKSDTERYQMVSFIYKY